MINAIPRPLRSMMAPLIKAAYAGWGDENISLSSEERLSAEKNVKTISRIALIALKSVAFAGLAGMISPLDSIKVSFVVGSMVSLPAVGLIVGGWLLHFGLIITIAAVALETFVPLVFGTAIAACGFGILEYHDRFQFGVVEILLDKAVKFLPEKWANYLA
jgi:hypothetical protein